MDIAPYIETDKQLLLQWNGSDSLFWDGFMWVSTSTFIWIPLAIILLYIVIRNNRPKEALLTFIAIALVITLADQTASGICKPLFARFRPTQAPEIMYLIDTVNGYRGGRYGFISSHAANTFAVAIFVSLLIRSKLLSVVLILWASLNAYSRIYLGVHYPGDILFGTLDGCLIGVGIYMLYQYVLKKMNKSYHFVSGQYTSSEYLYKDVQLLTIAFISTILIITISGMVVSEILHF